MLFFTFHNVYPNKRTSFVIREIWETRTLFKQMYPLRHNVSEALEQLRSYRYQLNVTYGKLPSYVQAGQFCPIGNKRYEIGFLYMTKRNRSDCGERFAFLKDKQNGHINDIAKTSFTTDDRFIVFPHYHNC